MSTTPRRVRGRLPGSVRIAVHVGAVVVWFAAGAATADDPQAPAKLATNARLDLTAAEAVGSIGDGQLQSGSGGIQRMNWVAESHRMRNYTVQFPVSHYGWREFAVRFTPERSGSVRLTLMGPWEEVTGGVIYRQEVHWDGLEVTSGTLSNGGFEAGSGDAAHGWQSNGGRIERASPRSPARDGSRMARTWHNASLSATIGVTGGAPVTVRGFARAVLPDGYREMRRIAERDTPAHRAAQRFRRGTNLGNYLEAPPGQDWGARYAAKDFENIRAEGFDHVRLPIAWHHYSGPAPEFKISDEFYRKVDFLVDQALKNRLTAIVNVHHFDDFTTNPSAERAKLLAIWRQIAAHYADRPDRVAFELLNEPKDAATTEAMNPIYDELIREIRRTNPDRTVFVGPGRWNQVSELPRLRLPDDDLNLIVTVHCYDPFEFTHQGASWVGPQMRSLKGIRYPGPPDEPLVPGTSVTLGASLVEWIDRYNKLPRESNPSSVRAFRGAIEQAREWSEYYGRPVHMGEFGAYEVADVESRVRFYREFRELLDKVGIGWAMWDWKAGFKYWDDGTCKPVPGMREALFARP